MKKTAQPDTRKRGKKPYRFSTTKSVNQTAEKAWNMSPEQFREAIDLFCGGNQSQFAHICGVTFRTVNRWASDDDPHPVPKVVQVLIKSWSLLSATDRETLIREAINR